MPTYEYECTACGHVFEKFQAISDDPERICPECQGPVKRRIGTGAGILFKGRGFYTTDYRSKEYKEKAKSDSSSPSPAAETKPASSSKGEATPPPSSPPSTGKTSSD